MPPRGSSLDRSIGVMAVMCQSFCDPQLRSTPTLHGWLILDLGGGSSMKRLLIVHNLLEGQKIVHEINDKDFAIEIVEGDAFDDNDDLDVESRLFFRLD